MDGSWVDAARLLFPSGLVLSGNSLVAKLGVLSERNPSRVRVSGVSLSHMQTGNQQPGEEGRGRGSNFPTRPRQYRSCPFCAIPSSNVTRQTITRKSKKKFNVGE